MFRTSVIIVIASFVASVAIGVIIGSMAGGGSDAPVGLASTAPRVLVNADVASPTSERNDATVDSVATPV